jgi:hypothetical protein
VRAPKAARSGSEARGASLLVKQAAGLLVACGVPQFEIVFTMARSAGMSDDELFIGSLDELTPEVFEVVTTLHGVVVEAPRSFAGVTFLPTDQRIERLAELGFGDHVDELHADAFALSVQTAALGDGAEQAGMRDTALDWLEPVLVSGRLFDLSVCACRARIRRCRVARPPRDRCRLRRGGSWWW